MRRSGSRNAASLVTLTAVAAALAVSTPVCAQYNPLTPSMAYMGMARAASLRRNGQEALAKSGHAAFIGGSAGGTAAAPAPARSGIGALFGGGGSDRSASSSVFAFTPAPAVSEQVRQRMIDAITRVDPAQRAGAEKTFDSRLTVLKAFDKLLGNYGYSANNLLDVYTGYAVIAWEIVNGADASGNAAGIRAVHAQLERSMLATPAVVQMSPELKQDTAEVLAYEAALAGNAKNELLARGDSATLQRLRDNVAASAQDLGLDVRGLQLTAQGFVAAR